MAVITPPSLTPAPTPAPQRNDRTTFSSRVDAFVTWLITAVTEFGAVASNVFANATDAFNSATTASTQAGNASTSAGTASTKATEAAVSALLAETLVESYQGALSSDPALDRHGNALSAGDWYTNSTSGFIRAYTGSAWTNGLTAVAGVTSLNGLTGALTGFVDLSTPQVLISKTVESLVLNNGYTEEVYVITDGASVDLNPANGSIQTWVLGANRTATASSFAAGQSLILGVDDGSTFSLTWPSVTWTKVGGAGTVPVLTATGKTWVVLWKVNGTLYGSLLGSA